MSKPTEDCYCASIGRDIYECERYHRKNPPFEIFGLEYCKSAVMRQTERLKHFLSIRHCLPPRVDKPAARIVVRKQVWRVRNLKRAVHNLENGVDKSQWYRPGYPHPDHRTRRSTGSNQLDREVAMRVDLHLMKQLFDALEWVDWTGWISFHSYDDEEGSGSIVFGFQDGVEASTIASLEACVPSETVTLVQPAGDYVCVSVHDGRDFEGFFSSKDLMCMDVHADIKVQGGCIVDRHPTSNVGAA